MDARSWLVRPIDDHWKPVNEVLTCHQKILIQFWNAKKAQNSMTRKLECNSRNLDTEASKKTSVCRYYSSCAKVEPGTSRVSQVRSLNKRTPKGVHSKANFHIWSLMPFSMRLKASAPFAYNWSPPHDETYIQVCLSGPILALKTRNLDWCGAFLVRHRETLRDCDSITGTTLSESWQYDATAQESESCCRKPRASHKHQRPNV